MNKQLLTPDLLKSRQHFHILDGLRGIAALAIVIFHFLEWIYPDFTQNVLGHGFLAVDFFFCLSGFVIGYAYDNRIQQMGLMEFFKSRLIRLHPLVIFGSVIGLLALLFDPFSSLTESLPLGKLILIFLCSLFLIPFPVMEARGFNLFSLNAPAWSLFWEYIANIFYALILCRLKRKYLIALAIIAATILGAISYQTGNLMGGWAGHNFWHGGARLFYSFLAGLLVYRYNWIIKNKLGFIGLSALLSLTFLMPFFPQNWLVELLIIVLIFPLLVSLGAGSSLSPKMEKACIFSGKISYPLYMTHYVAIWIFGNYFLQTNPDKTELTLVITIGTILLVGLGYLTMIAFDTPVRNYLNAKRRRKLNS